MGKLNYHRRQNSKVLCLLTTKDVLIETLTMIILPLQAHNMLRLTFPKTINDLCTCYFWCWLASLPPHTNRAYSSRLAKFLPPIEQSFEQLNILYLLGSVHYRPLGDYH